MSGFGAYLNKNHVVVDSRMSKPVTNYVLSQPQTLGGAMNNQGFKTGLGPGPVINPINHDPKVVPTTSPV